jgi:hypothetical protein
MSAVRQRLPNRRLAETLSVEVAGLPHTATVGRAPSGKILEIFLSNHRAGSQADAYARESAIAASLAFQFGCPLETLRGALLRDSHGRPQTPLGVALDLIAGERGR